MTLFFDAKDDQCPSGSFSGIIERMTCDIVAWMILGITGALLVISRIGFNKVVDWRIGIGLTLVGLSLFALATNFPELGVGFGIVGTLVVAGAALMAIRQSAEQLTDDKRDRRLGAIILWTEDILRCEAADPLSPLPIEAIASAAQYLSSEGIKAVFEYHDQHRRTNLVLRYMNLAAMRPRILLIAKQLDKQLGSDLLSLAEQTGDELEAHVTLGPEFIKGELGENDYKEHWQSLRASAMKLLEQAQQMFG